MRSDIDGYKDQVQELKERVVKYKTEATNAKTNAAALQAKLDAANAKMKTVQERYDDAVSQWRNVSATMSKAFTFTNKRANEDDTEDEDESDAEEVTPSKRAKAGPSGVQKVTFCKSGERPTRPPGKNQIRYKQCTLDFRRGEACCWLEVHPYANNKKAHHQRFHQTANCADNKMREEFATEQEIERMKAEWELQRKTKK